MSNFTSKKVLDTPLQPPRTDGPMAPSPYAGYTLVEHQQVQKFTIFQLLVQRWRTLSAGNMFDVWENLAVDVAAIGIVILIIWGIYSAVTGGDPSKIIQP